MTAACVFALGHLVTLHENWLHRSETMNFILKLVIYSIAIYDDTALCGLWGCKNRPAPFPGRMSYKVTTPGLVSVLYLSMRYTVLLFISAHFYVSICVYFDLFVCPHHFMFPWSVESSPLQFLALA